MTSSYIYFTETMYALIYIFFVGPLYLFSYNDAAAGPHAHHGAAASSAGVPIVMCMMLYLCNIIYVFLCHEITGFVG